MCVLIIHKQSTQVFCSFTGKVGKISAEETVMFVSLHIMQMTVSQKGRDSEQLSLQKSSLFTQISRLQKTHFMKRHFLTLCCYLK